MTSTAPWRRMILHFSHIGFTDGRTFMVPFQEFGPVTRSGCRGSSRCYVTDGAHAGALRTRGQLKIAKRHPRRLDPNESRSTDRIRALLQGVLALVPRCEHTWPVRRDGDRELEVGGQRA